MTRSTRSTPGWRRGSAPSWASPSGAPDERGDPAAAHAARRGRAARGRDAGPAARGQRPPAPRREAPGGRATPGAGAGRRDPEGSRQARPRGRLAMAGAGRVELTLLGQTLTVRTAAEPEYVRTLARYLEERVATLTRTGIRDPMAALTLAALDITDELFRAREDHARERRRGGTGGGALVDLLERIAPAPPPPRPWPRRVRPADDDPRHRAADAPHVPPGRSRRLRRDVRGRRRHALSRRRQAAVARRRLAADGDDPRSLAAEGPRLVGAGGADDRRARGAGRPVRAGGLAGLRVDLDAAAPVVGQGLRDRGGPPHPAPCVHRPGARARA